MKILLLQSLVEALVLILQILNLLTQHLFRTHLGIELSHAASVDGNELKKMNENEGGIFSLVKVLCRNGDVGKAFRISTNIHTDGKEWSSLYKST